MKNIIPRWLLAYFVFFFMIQNSQAQCPTQLSSSFSGGQLVLTYAPGEVPFNLQSIIVDFPGVSGNFPLVSTSSTTWQTLATVFGGITLTGEVRIINTAGQALPCLYVNGESTNALPVELSSFQGNLKDQDIQLLWTTESEDNNAGFEIQRSFDGTTFETIANQSGAGTTDLPQQYDYQDKDIRSKALGGAVYYRLRQIDYDGGSAFSSLLAIDLKIETNGFSIRSITGWNSPDRIIKIYYHCPASIQKVNYQVANLNGERLLASSTYPEHGFNYLEIDLSVFRGSFFVLSLYNGKEIIVKKIGMAGN